MTATGLLTWTNPAFSGNPTVVIIDVTDQDNNVSGTTRPSPCRSSPSPAPADLARRISAVEHLGRWCRRNPRVAVLAASVLLLLETVATTSTVVAQDRMTNSITLTTRPGNKLGRRVEIGFCLLNPPAERAGIDTCRGPGDRILMTQNGFDPLSIKSHRDRGTPAHLR
jgi:hypothetical protein